MFERIRYVGAALKQFTLAGVVAGAMTLSIADAAPPTNLADQPLLQNTKGKVVLVDFWASWCVPCRKSFPWMNSLQKKYADKGLVVVAINLDATRSDADEFLKAVPAQFRIEYDPKATLATLLDVSAMPTSFLLDRNGNIVKHHAGFREAQVADREAEIAQLLK